MRCGENGSPAFVSTFRNLPYNSSLASSASTSTASVFSDTSSQSSDDTSVSANSSDSESCERLCMPSKASMLGEQHGAAFRDPWPKPMQLSQNEAVPIELRQNARRSSTGPVNRVGCPPSLVRQSDRKVNFVDNLVDSSTQIVEAIWPLSSLQCRSRMGSRAVLPLRTFIQETLRRSRTSYSTLQVALYYLILIKPHVPKFDFTMEQPEDCYAKRVLQCGRRMFLAALILASKYLQDRNYSARAWSKISGLATLEINQNEMMFLAAVNYKLHITDEVFRRWTEIVLKYTPPPTPPSPGGSIPVSAPSVEWKQLILQLMPDLDNVEGLFPVTTSPKLCDFTAVTPRLLPPVTQEMSNDTGYDSDVTPTPQSYPTPVIMEPTPPVTLTPGRRAPALGLLPTPRLTPQVTGFGFNTPAASLNGFGFNALSAAGPHCPRSSAMVSAMAQANNTTATQYLDRPSVLQSSPLAYCPVRRSSLATTVSTASSPESMVSDTSRSSRSSSISSASSYACAPPVKIGLPARPRFMKQTSGGTSLRTMIASVPEDSSEPAITSSPELYTGPVGKLGDLSLNTPLGQREAALDCFDTDAARALAELQYQRSVTASASRPSLKRSRTWAENPVQEDVRSLLNKRSSTMVGWSNHMVCPPGAMQVDTEAVSRKRLCCSAETSNMTDFTHLPRPTLNASGPGKWQGIL